MKLMIVVSQFHQGAGYPRYGVKVANGLADRGHEVTVLTNRADPSEKGPALAFRYYKLPRSGKLTTMAAEPWVVTRALREAQPEFDVMVSVGIPCLAPVVLIGLGSHRGFYRATLATLHRPSLRWAVEHVRPFHRVVMAWEKEMLRRRCPIMVVVGADRYANEYPDLFGFPRDRVSVVPMGVDLDAFRFDSDLRQRARRELNIPDNVHLLLAIAGRMRQKGLDTLIDAAALLPDEPAWQLVIAGDAGRSSALMRQSAALRSAGRMRVLGRVAEVRPLYCAADLVVFPSRYDPWGLVVTEALACGTPVVASVMAGSSMAIVEGTNGATVANPDDVLELRDTVARLMAGIAAFDRTVVRKSVERLSWDAGTARLEQHLERVAAGRRLGDVERKNGGNEAQPDL